MSYHDGMLYTGVWGTSEVVTADVRDPLRPRIVSRTPLDGYGDGLTVHDGKLFAATGHHSRARIAIRMIPAMAGAMASKSSHWPIQPDPSFSDV